MEKARDQLNEHLQLDLHDYLTVAFAFLESLMTNHHGWLDEPVAKAFNWITDGLEAVVKTVERNLVPPAMED